MSIDKLLKIEVISWEKPMQFLEGVSITSVNDKGKFDILFDHANFITLIKEFVEIVKADRSKVLIKLETGVIYCKSNKIKILISE